jgi:hypothetical protein
MRLMTGNFQTNDCYDLEAARKLLVMGHMPHQLRRERYCQVFVTDHSNSATKEVKQPRVGNRCRFNCYLHPWGQATYFYCGMGPVNLCKWRLMDLSACSDSL